MTIKIGARNSPLSLAQTSLVARALEKFHPALAAEIVPIKTAGDRLREPLAKIGGKGLFTREIEEELLAGRIDLAVHSAKDLPAELPPGLTLGAAPKRANPRDVLFSRYPGGLQGLPQGARLGTCGLRRQAQILAVRPDLTIAPLRGNVGTRLKKIKTEVEATILAAAGLERLAITHSNMGPLPPHNAEALPLDLMLPAAGQGILALQFREDDARTEALLAPLNHVPTSMALAAERGFLRRLGGGCLLPVAAFAEFMGESLTLEALIASPDGRRIFRDKKTVEPDSLTAAANLGAFMAEHLLALGGRAILDEVMKESA